MIELDAVVAGYGSVSVLRDVDLKANTGLLTCIVGLNGAGKTTTLRVISGAIRPTAGSVFINGRRTARASIGRRVRDGIAVVPEGRELFPSLTVRENLVLGAYTRHRRQTTEQLEVVFGLFPFLSGRLRQVAGSLSGGEAQMLAIGRALMAAPRALLLDEPSLGLAPEVTRRIFGELRKLADAGMTVLMAEQNVSAALEVADQVVVLDRGAVIASNGVDQFRDDPGFVRRYLWAGTPA